jgi:hypothetical protein
MGSPFQNLGKSFGKTSGQRFISSSAVESLPSLVICFCLWLAAGVIAWPCNGCCLAGFVICS